MMAATTERHVDIGAIKFTEKQQLLRWKAANHKHTLAVGGSRSGKTFTLCAEILSRAMTAPGSRHLIYRRYRASAVAAIGKDTMPKVAQLIGLVPPHAKTSDLITWHDQEAYYSLWNGSEIWIGGVDESNIDRILGREYATLFGNEASEFSFSTREQVLTRLAQKVAQQGGSDLPLREYCDLNPTTTAHWTYALWLRGVNPETRDPIDRENYAHQFINPTDNMANLPADVLETLKHMSGRARRRFLLGQYTAEAENGLWRSAILGRAEAPEILDRILVAIDPAASTAAGADETGVVVVGEVGEPGHKRVYVLEDASGKYKPQQWAAVAMRMASIYGADAIVAEVNNGGDMVEAALRAAGYEGRVLNVHASKGKVMRAEPVVALYERGLVYHTKEFPQLEEQMLSITLDFDRKAQGYSPDRVDALVWAITALRGSVQSQGDKTAAKPRITPRRRR